MAPGGNGEAATAQAYMVREGDTLRSVARLFFGDESLWYLIAGANGLTSSDTLAAGMVITIPNKVINAHNKSSTFRVYDPNQALGDIQPNQDPPQVAQTAPPKARKGCGAG